RQAQGADPAAAVPGRAAGGDRERRRRAQQREGAPQERDGEVLWGRHQPEAEAPREAEGGEEADEGRRLRRDSAGGVPRGAEPRRGLTVPGRLAKEPRPRDATPPDLSRRIVRAPNHLGDVVLALPALVEAEPDDVLVVRGLAPILRLALPHA